MAYSANKTTLSYRTGTSGAFILIPNLMEVPEFGGTPEKIDVTTLGNHSKRYIPGIRDYGDLVFQFLYDNSEGGNFRTLRKLSEKREAVQFQLTYPDNTAHQFLAQLSVKMDAGTVNGALTFRATMLLQSDITTKDKGDEVQEAIALPQGVLKSRMLNPEEYTVEVKGVFQTRTIASEAFDNTQVDEDPEFFMFSLEEFRYGDHSWWWDVKGELTKEYPVAVGQMRQTMFGRTWEGKEVAIPQNALDISKIKFSGWGPAGTVWTFADSIYVEPYVVEGFQTHRVFGEFTHNKGSEDESRVAYSIIVGARPNRQGDGARVLYAQEDCCNHLEIWSGVRFELLEGPGGFGIGGIGMQTLAPAENTFVESRRHLIEFDTVLEEGDMLNIWASIRGTKEYLPDPIWGGEGEKVTISQPISFDFLQQGKTAQEVAPVMFQWTFPEVWAEPVMGVQRAKLSKQGVEIQTGILNHWDWNESPDLEWSSRSGALTWDIDVHAIEVIGTT